MHIKVEVIPPEGDKVQMVTFYLKNRMVSRVLGIDREAPYEWFFTSRSVGKNSFEAHAKTYKSLRVGRSEKIEITFVE